MRVEDRIAQGLKDVTDGPSKRWTAPQRTKLILRPAYRYFLSRARYLVLLLAVLQPSAASSDTQWRLNFPRMLSEVELSTTGFAFVNTSSSVAVATFNFYGSNGSVVGQSTLSIPARGQVSRLASEILPTAKTSAWVQVVTSSEEVQGFEFVGDFATFADGAGPAPEARQLSVINFSRQDIVHLVNPSSQAATVQMGLYDSSGGALTTRSVSLGPFQPASFRLADLSNNDGIALVSLTANVTISASVTTKVSGGSDVAFSNALPVSMGPSDLFYPFIPTGPQGTSVWKTLLGIANIGSTSQRLSLTFTPERGEPLTIEQNLAPKASLGDSAANLFSLPSNEFRAGWIRVSATGPLAGVAAFQDLASGSLAIVPTQSSGSTRFFFGHIANLSPWYTGIALLNTTTTAAAVEIYALDGNGQLLGNAGFSLDGNVRRTAMLSQFVPQVLNRASDGGWVFVRTTNGVPLLGFQLFGHAIFPVLATVPGFALPTTSGFSAITSPITVNAGPDQTVAFPLDIVLQGTATDSGGSTLMVSWSKISGPGNVTFGDAGAFTTTATFSASGTYLLRFTASDGALSSNDDVVIVVNPAVTDVPLIDSSRVVQWQGNVGVTGDIPTNRPNCTTPACNMVFAGTVSTSTINAAIQSAPDHTVVRIPAGTYKLSGSIQPKSNVTLRGAGMGVTILQGTPGFFGDGLISYNDIKDWYLTDQPSYDLLSPRKGDTTIATVMNHNWSVGDYIQIDMLTDPTGDPVIDNTLESGGFSESCRNPGAACRAVGQTVRIVEIPSPNRAVIDTPLYWTYNKAPQGTRISSYHTGMGFEDFTIDNTLSQSEKIIHFSGAFESWILRVEAISVNRHGIFIYGAYRSTIRSCVLHEGRAGTNVGYTVQLWNRASANLFEDNIIYNLGIMFLLDGSITGNVFAYNYGTSPVYGTNSGGTEMGNHAAHPMMNVFEGNQFEGRFRFDLTHGTTSHGTLFRNRVINDQNPAYDSARNLIDLWAYARYFNIVGNVLGIVGQETLYQETSGLLDQHAIVVYSFGERTLFGARGADPGVLSTVYRQGNWDSVTGSVRWDEDIVNPNHTLPASLYLSAKPAWFGKCAWPPIGPDLNPMVTDIPAKRRYDGNPCY